MLSASSDPLSAGILTDGATSILSSAEAGTSAGTLVQNSSNATYTGSLTLSGSNTYTGGTTLTAGTLRVANSLPLDSTVSLTAANAGSLVFNNNTGSATTTAGVLVPATSTGVTTSGATLTVGSQNLNTYPTQAGALTLAAAGTLTPNNNPVVSGGGTLTLTNNQPLATAIGSTTINGGTLRFNNTVGNATIGTGVTATVASGATLELPGTISALSSGTYRLNPLVGAIDGSGATMVTAGSDLTANHIVQSALVIGGATNSGVVTIGPSDASGHPLPQNGLTLAGSLTPSGPFGAGTGLLGAGSTLVGAGTTHTTTHVVFSHKMVSAHDPLIAAQHFAGHWAMVSAGSR
jgi:fibronectin-binding autotransporter adhesin